MPDGSSSPRRRRLAATALAVYWLALFVGTHWPRGLLLEDQRFVVGGDKLLHFSAYAVLGALMLLAVRLHRPTASAAAALSQCARWQSWLLFRASWTKSLNH